MACQKGFDKCAALLLQHDADLNLINKDNCTELFMASQTGHYECVPLLLKYGADTNIPITVPDGKITSPLLITSQIGFIKRVELLLLHDAVDENQETSVFATCRIQLNWEC